MQLLLGNDPSCAYNDSAPNAVVGTAPLWDQNFNGEKFEVAYYFVDHFDEHRKEDVRTKLDEFDRDTCIKMVEVDPDDPK